VIILSILFRSSFYPSYILSELLYPYGVGIIIFLWRQHHVSWSHSSSFFTPFFRSLRRYDSSRRAPWVYSAPCVAPLQHALRVYKLLHSSLCRINHLLSYKVIAAADRFTRCTYCRANIYLYPYIFCWENRWLLTVFPGRVPPCRVYWRFFLPAFLWGATRFLAITYSKYYSRSCGSLALSVAFWRLSGGFLAAFRRFAGGFLPDSYHMTSIMWLLNWLALSRAFWQLSVSKLAAFWQRS